MESNPVVKLFNNALETAIEKGMIEKTGETSYWFTTRFLSSYELEVDSVLENPKLDKKSIEESSDHALSMTVLRHMGPEGIEQVPFEVVVHLVKTLRDANHTREAKGLDI